MSFPGIGPIIANAMVAAIGNGAAFAKGREAAWLSLLPKQMSTGDRTILKPDFLNLRKKDQIVSMITTPKAAKQRP